MSVNTIDHLANQLSTELTTICAGIPDSFRIFICGLQTSLLTVIYLCTLMYATKFMQQNLCKYRLNNIPTFESRLFQEPMELYFAAGVPTTTNLNGTVTVQEGDSVNIACMLFFWQPCSYHLMVPWSFTSTIFTE